MALLGQAHVMRHVTKSVFSQTQIWRILGSLGFSPQKPERRAIERDEQAVQTWRRKTWPKLKKPGARGG
jgi:transposase